MLVTVTVMIWAFVSTPPKSFKLPGDALHQNVCLGFVVQYMVVSFVGITVMYLQCFHAVHQSVQTLSGIMTLRTEEFALRKRVITNCVLMVATFVGCYGLFPVTTVFLFFTPEWEEPVLLEVVSLCLVAMDGIVTPLIIWHLNRDLGKSGGGGTEGGGSGMSTRLSQKSKG
ncbi:hypothetical protein BDR26DRAFT_862435 [Obelidium mucronatum]|nr:hypothetical protein BDR26DRAFT_862435 [Obelidium mucronatum]